ncbi:MAG: STAS domain-containing protein [Actinobacteria bacterium]|nr:STAS domain-containing protein [Actinomycetota bacterium]
MDGGRGAADRDREAPAVANRRDARSHRRAGPACRPDFAVTERAIDAQCHVVAVRGELDLFSTRELQRTLAEALDAGCIRIIVDLSQTPFVVSCTLGVLIGAVRRLCSHHGAMAIVNVNEDVAHAFEVTGLDQIFTIVPTREDAISAVAPLAAQRVL